MITKAWPIDGFSKRLRPLGNGFTRGIPNPVWIALVFLIIFSWLMSNTRFGWHIYATGGGEERGRGVPEHCSPKREREGMCRKIAGSIGAFVGIHRQPTTQRQLCAQRIVRQGRKGPPWS